MLLIWHKVPLASVFEAWHRLSWSLVMLALACQVFFLELRAVRMATMMGPGQPMGRRFTRFYQWFGPAAAYSMTCLVIPGGVGELMLPVYLKPHGVSTGSSLGIAAGGRLFDVGWSVLLAFLLGLWILPRQGWHSVRLTLMVGAVVVGAVFVAIRLIDQERVLQAASRRNLPTWADRVLSTILKAQEVIKRLSGTDLVLLSLMTLGIKFFSTLFYMVIAYGMGYHLGFFHLATAMMFYSLLMIFPVQGLGGVGTSEAWWTIGLTMVGMPLKSALVLSIAFQVLNLLYISVIGGVFMIAQFRTRQMALRKS